MAPFDRRSLSRGVEIASQERARRVHASPIFHHEPHGGVCVRLSSFGRGVEALGGRQRIGKVIDGFTLFDQRVVRLRDGPGTRGTRLLVVTFKALLLSSSLG